MLNHEGLEIRSVDKGKPPKYRSKLEGKVAEALYSFGVSASYEGYKLIWQDWANGNEYRYVPDFVLSDGTIIEAKGRYRFDHMERHESLLRTFPAIRLCIAFQCNNWISSDWDERYSDWCEDRGIEWTLGAEIPTNWFAGVKP